MPRQNVQKLIDKSEEFEKLVDYDGENRARILHLLKHLGQVANVLEGRSLEFLKRSLENIADGR